MASTCVSHDALTGYTPAHDLAFLESQERAPAIRGLLYKEGQRQGCRFSYFSLGKYGENCRPQRDNAHVRWDEQCIAEHDKADCDDQSRDQQLVACKERGTRQKIDEPTP